MKHGYCPYLLICALVALSGCATIIHGSTQEVSVLSDPLGATVIIEGQKYGNTPVTIDLQRKHHYLVEIQQPGYSTDYLIIQRRVSGWSYLNVGLVGFTVDAYTGGMYRLVPDTLRAFLWPAGQDTMDRESPIVAYFEYLQRQNSGFWNRPILGTSLTYIWENSSANSGLPGTFPYLYQEYTWSLNLAYPLSKRWAVGLDNKLIWTESTFSARKNYRITGAQAQFNLTPSTPNRLFLYSGLYQGNYCTCGEGEPYRKDNLMYWGLGFGWNVRLSNNIYLDLGFENFEMVSREPGKYNYTQYIIGLDFHLPPRRLKPMPDSHTSPTKQ